jgi:signal transduction histidine kinase
MEEASHVTFISLLLPIAFIVFVISVGVIVLNQHFQKNLYRQKLEKETLKTKNQQDLLHTVIQTQEEERKRIARDLHDEMGALLSMARMHLLQAEGNSTDPTSATYLKNARELTEASLENIRRISHELMPPLLEKFGLLQTLESISKQFELTNKMEIEIIATPNLPRFAVSTEINLYRVVMEMVNNTIKHSSANHIIIQFEYHPDVLVVEYRDNGSGLTLPVLAERTGAGLKNMEARINTLKGSLSLANGSPGGMHAIIRIPLTMTS